MSSERVRASNTDVKTRRCRFLRVCRLVLFSFVFLLLQRAPAETLPGEVSDIIRNLGEMRDLTWSMLSVAREAYATNSSELSTLNVRYIEARAVANSLIEQFQLETAARTPLQPKRYQEPLARTREQCSAFTNEWHRLMTKPVKTRGAASSSASVTNAAGNPVDQSFAYAGKAVGVADGLLTIVTKHKQAFRNLDESQRVAVRNLLEERKWRPLDWQASSSPAGGGNANDPAPGLAAGAAPAVRPSKSGPVPTNSASGP